MKTIQDSAKQKVKKTVISVVGAVVISSLLLGTATAAGIPVSVVTDGIKAPLYSAVVDNGVTMLPLRLVSEKLGAKVAWDEKTKRVSITKSGKSIGLTVGSKTAKVNGVAVILDAKVTRKDGIVLVPLRLVGEELSAEVKWEKDSNAVYINTPGKNLGDVDRFGRKIRTTNLPKNYKDYPYILADIPNEMYEMKVYASDPNESLTSRQLYETDYMVKDKEIVQGWKMHAEQYYNLLLNVDYRTIDYKWAETVLSHKNKWNNYQINDLKAYVDWVKKNKIVIEGALEAEPSMLFYNGYAQTYIRSKFTFTLKEFKEYKNLIYDDTLGAKNFAKGQQYEGYTDVPMGTNVMDSSNLKVSLARLISANSIIRKAN